jgi:hypothetical protein
MTSSYAGCGCTALTPSYAGPSFVPSRPRSFGAEGEKDGEGDRPRYGLAVVSILSLFALGWALNALEQSGPRAAKSIPTRNVPRSRPSR